MASSGDSKICPRCNSVLPASAAFCGDCGYHLAEPPEPPPQAAPNPLDDAPTQRIRPDAAGANAASQSNEPQQGDTFPNQPAGYAAQNQSDYPPAPPPPPEYAGAMARPPARKNSAAKWIGGLLALVIVIGALAAAWVLYLSPSHTDSPFFDRHGLQSNVPLPGQSTFMVQKSLSRTDPTTNTLVSADSWAWTVTGSNPTAVQQFYQQNLPKNGWGKFRTFTGQNGESDLTACQGNQVLIVGVGKKIVVTNENGKVTNTIIAPHGGAALATELSSSKELTQLFCSNQ
ncbi:MAG TPA: hypothetical protein VKT82_29315 [Ktedonobacterales bacterium]|nr:hypothetical protein [Ktedonobacterales bacterium]